MPAAEARSHGVSYHKTKIKAALAILRCIATITYALKQAEEDSEVIIIVIIINFF